jgi:hypothetical protein
VQVESDATGVTANARWVEQSRHKLAWPTGEFLDALAEAKKNLPQDFNLREVFADVTPLYSRTWMFFSAQMSLRAFGQTVTLTSPRCAVLSRYMKVRDCPMPPPMLKGIRSSRIAW